MSFFLSPLGNGQQYLSVASQLATAIGGTFNTYLAGTSTPYATFTSSSGAVNNPVSIAVGANGTLPNPVWIAGGISIKIIILDALSNPIGPTYDNIYGINDPSTGGTAPATAISYTPKGSGAVVTTVSAELQQYRSVFDFMTTVQIADVQARTLLQDVTTAINTGLTATAGGTLYAPPGNYLISGPLNVQANSVFKGDGPFTTVLTTNNATADTIAVKGNGVYVTGFGFTSTVTKSAGAYYNNGGFSDLAFNNFQMFGAFRGILISGGVIINVGYAGLLGDIRNSVASTGYGMYITGINSAINITNITMDAPAGSMPANGILTDSCGDIIIDSCNIIHQGNDLTIAPGTGAVCASVYAQNTFFDTATTGLVINPTSTGSVVRCRFTSCWFGSHTSVGVNIIAGGATTVAGVHFIDPHIVSCANNGFNISTATGVSDWSIIGGIIAGQTANSGISLPTGITDFVIEGVTIGAGGGLAGNTNGINLAGTIANCVIANNKIIGNSGASISGGSVSGANVRVVNNAGFNPQGYAGIVVGASPFTYTAGITPEVIMVNSVPGLASLSVAVNGNVVFNNVMQATVKISAGETVTITYGAGGTPGASKYRE